MARSGVLKAVAGGLAGLALAAALGGGDQRAAEAAEPPALVPLMALGPVIPGLPPEPRTHLHRVPRMAGPQNCLIQLDRCSAEPCVQFVRRRAQRRCDPYPDAVPRMIPVR